jgi:hypothetical protein
MLIMKDLNCKMPGQCPACGGIMQVTGLECSNCRTTVGGEFELDEFFKLNAEQLLFAKTFIRNRGNIKDIEKELGISYPTVRNKLDELIEVLGFKVEQKEKERKERKQILNQLANGEISSDEAIERFKVLAAME